MPSGCQSRAQGASQVSGEWAGLSGALPLVRGADLNESHRKSNLMKVRYVLVVSVVCLLFSMWYGANSLARLEAPPPALPAQLTYMWIGLLGMGVAQVLKGISKRVAKIEEQLAKLPSASGPESKATDDPE